MKICQPCPKKERFYFLSSNPRRPTPQLVFPQVFPFFNPRHSKEKTQTERAAKAKPLTYSWGRCTCEDRTSYPSGNYHIPPNRKVGSSSSKSALGSGYVGHVIVPRMVFCQLWWKRKWKVERLVLAPSWKENSLFNPLLMGGWWVVQLCFLRYF